MGVINTSNLALETIHLKIPDSTDFKDTSFPSNLNYISKNKKVKYIKVKQGNNDQTSFYPEEPTTPMCWAELMDNIYFYPLKMGGTQTNTDKLNRVPISTYNETAQSFFVLEIDAVLSWENSSLKHKLNGIGVDVVIVIEIYYEP